MTIIRYIGAFIGSALAYFLGQWDILIQILITLTVFDFITGVLSAGYNKKLCSDIGYKGIVKLYERSYNRTYANPMFIRMYLSGSA
jgi:phage-related holin